MQRRHDATFKVHTHTHIRVRVRPDVLEWCGADRRTLTHTRTWFALPPHSGARIASARTRQLARCARTISHVLRERARLTHIKAAPGSTESISDHLIDSAQSSPVHQPTYQHVQAGKDHR